MININQDGRHKGLAVFLFVHFIMDGIVIALYEGQVCAFVRIAKF